MSSSTAGREAAPTESAARSVSIVGIAEQDVASAEAAEPVLIRLLGSTALLAGAHAERTPRSRKARALLAALAVAHGHGRRVARSELATLLWGRSAERESRASLRGALSELKQALGPHASIVGSDGDELWLAPSKCVVDAQQVLAELAQFQAHGVALPAAIARCSDYLKDFFGLTPECDQWIHRERGLFDERLTNGLERRVALLRTNGVPPEDRAAAARRWLEWDATSEVAARELMQALADAGDTSAAIRAYERCRRALREILDVAPSALTEATLHNLRLKRTAAVEAVALSPATSAPKTPSVADRRERRSGSSLAVLPFTSLNAEGSSDYFADGVTDEIITQLSRIKSLFVVARNSSFIYRDGKVGVREIGLNLGVSYVIEGTVRRSADAIRISVKLIDSGTGRYLWAAGFDGDDKDVFQLQGQVAASIAAAIEPALLRAEIHLARRPGTTVTAYDSYLKGMWHRSIASGTDSRLALQHLQKAIALDPGFAPALAQASMCITAMRNQGFAQIADSMVLESVRLAEAAVEADPEDPEVLAVAGHTIAAQTGEFRRGLRLIEKSLRINPNSADAWARAAMTRVYLNELDEAIESAQRSIALNPLDPDLRLPLCALGYAHLFSHRFTDALHWADEALSTGSRYEMAYRIFLAAAGLSNRQEDAARVLPQFLASYPEFRCATWSKRDAFTNTSQIDTMVSGLRRAGVPE